MTRKYTAPISVGLGVSYAFSSRWRLHTGLEYMHTSTTLTQHVGQSVVTTRNQLAYVGLPLRASLQVVQLKRFRLYGIGGMEAYVNVRNRRTTNAVVTTDHNDRLQFSASLSAGAELCLWHHVAAYVEPGAKYYFDNGSNVDTYFKQHHFAPNLQLGLRYNF